MGNRKHSTSETMRIEQELKTVSTPLYVLSLTILLKIFFIVYDSINYIPFMIFANPGKKLELSKREKVSFFYQIIKILFRVEKLMNRIRILHGDMLKLLTKNFGRNCFLDVTPLEKSGTTL